MATLVFTAIGTLLGGPLGGAIGAMAGQAFDQAVLFKPKGREGPRLSDLRVQTSTYGSQVPRLYGRMRVAGSVIWATDLKERKSESGGGKGQPSVTTYSYSCSFAVALSSRRVTRVGRIWADGNLLRGSAGDFKSDIGRFRLFTGDEDQGAAQLIASAQGVANTPAHRGMAYALFEDLQLEDFGNRIPSLTFELFADDDPVSVAAIVHDLSGGRLGADAGPGVRGYAAGGASMADAAAPLADALGLVPRVTAEGIVLTGATGAEAVLAQDGDVRAVNGREAGRARLSREPAANVPVELNLRHYDPARDYQAGVQRAVRPGAGRGTEAMDIAATLDAAQARGMAEHAIAARWRGRERLELVRGWRDLTHMPGEVVQVEGRPGAWRITQADWETTGLKITLQRVGAGPDMAAEADAGAPVLETDMEHGPTVLAAFDLPPLTGAVVSAPVVAVAAAGPSDGWRRAALLLSEADGASVTPIGRTALPAVMGQVTVPPAPGSPMLFDDRGAIEVALLAPGMTLAGAEDAALIRGANLALVGDELIQFGRAVMVGPQLYRLTRLLRGRRGTEWAMETHAPGERFVMIDADRMTMLPEGLARIGGTLTLLASGRGDATPAEARVTVMGQAMLPPAPVQGRWMAGDRRLEWTRRSRAGWDWPDGIDAPLVEEREAYQLRIIADGREVRRIEVAEPHFLYTMGMAAADGVGGEAARIEVRQVGMHGLSQPLMMDVTL